MISIAIDDGDGGISSASTVAIRVSTNDAPRLDASKSPILAAIIEDNRTSYGTPVWMLLGGASDVDVGAARALALTAASGAAHGTASSRLLTRVSMPVWRSRTNTSEY